MQESFKKCTSSVAWFKLAQLVTRKEREKALGLYKLLSYSLENKAYALQVEADLLLALEENEDAMTKYQQAAFLYKKEKNLVLATSIYEHLRSLNPDNSNFLCTLVELYARLDWTEKIEERFDMLLDFYRKNKMTKDEISRTVKLVVNLFALEKKDISRKRFSDFIKLKSPEFVSQVA